LGLLFQIWLLLFLRVAMPIAQQQELRADELPYRTVGALPTIAALAKIRDANGDGSDDFVSADEKEDLEHNERLFSTHAPLRDRVRLASAFAGAGLLPPDERQALVLIAPIIQRVSLQAEPASASTTA